MEKKERTEEEQLFEIEKKLGRHENEKVEKEKLKKNRKFIKYFMLVTNMVYILTIPILSMLGLYILLKKTVLKKEYPILLIVFLFLGAATGYWSLIKELMKINRQEDKERKKEKIENDSTK